jgi:glucose-6-phosphate dehydrogenase assembly protein OpcA
MEERLMPATVEPEKILKDLRNLWNDLGRGAEVSGGVLRACEMTLVVAAESEAECDENRRQDLRHTLGVLMHSHPARAILLRLRETAGLDANVFSQCWMPFGKHQQICAEGIEIGAGVGEVYRVAQLLLPLIVSDLPAVLWCRGNRVFSGETFGPLLPMVQKVIVDSVNAPDPNAAIAAIRDLRRQGRLVADLAWTKLTGLRELVASLFDEGTAWGIKSAQVLYGGDAASPSSIYFAKWIERCLPEARVSLSRGAEGPRGLRSIVLSGDHCEVTITRPEPTILEVHCGGQIRRSTTVLLSEETLMSEELSILGPDPVYDKVLG